MRRILPIALMGVLALGLGARLAVAADTTKYEKQKVIYDVSGDDEKQLKAALGNIQNHINRADKENFDLRVVLHDNGLALLRKAKTDPDMQSKVINLKKQGIRFLVCADSLRSKKIDYKKDLYGVNEQDIVRSGVVTIAVLRAKGYSYLKPSETTNAK